MVCFEVALRHHTEAMFETLTFYHSLFRWLVVASLLYALYRAGRGYYSRAPFTKTDNAVRHWTATIAHAQLVLGMLLYIKSPSVKYFWGNFREAVRNRDVAFFALVHIALMLLAIIMITIGSSLAKRRSVDNEKFRTMLVWFAIAFTIIVIAIPWPFSPLANRPYFR